MSIHARLPDCVEAFLRACDFIRAEICKLIRVAAPYWVIAIADFFRYQPPGVSFHKIVLVKTVFREYRCSAAETSAKGIGQILLGDGFWIPVLRKLGIGIDDICLVIILLSELQHGVAIVQLGQLF
ncbi:hypothetical protein ASD28_25850 [Massilia sp. Root133]|nr:hypothetical protein ASD28_25850 [Massilia sp. Root133]